MINDFEGRPWFDAGLISRPIPPIDELLSKLESPILIMNGENDLPDFIAAADAIEPLVPHCRKAMIAEAGGFPLWEFPERVNKIVRRFFRDMATAE